MPAHLLSRISTFHLYTLPQGLCLARMRIIIHELCVDQTRDEDRPAGRASILDYPHYARSPNNNNDDVLSHQIAL